MNDRLKHDLRHWLTALRGALDEGDLLLARRVSEQMAGLLEAPTVTPGRTSRVMAISANDAAAALGGSGVRVEPAAPDVFVCAESATLGRVLINLVANARQTGGAVTLRVGRDGAYASIAVEDTGPGIPADVLARMFEPGFTTRAATGGSGLGLAIVRELVEAAGGSVTAESTVGRGTTVTVRWPSSPPPPSNPPPSLGTTVAAGTILLVDDEPIVRQLAERALRAAGWKIVAADSAENALASMRTIAPDAVVADLTLPGMDGRELVAALRQRWPNLPAVMVSGYTDSAGWADPDPEKTVFLAKPFPLSALVAAVKALVRV